MLFWLIFTLHLQWRHLIFLCTSNFRWLSFKSESQCIKVMYYIYLNCIIYRLLCSGFTDQIGLYMASELKWVWIKWSNEFRMHTVYYQAPSYISHNASFHDIILDRFRVPQWISLVEITHVSYIIGSYCAITTVCILYILLFALWHRAAVRGFPLFSWIHCDREQWVMA